MDRQSRAKQTRDCAGSGPARPNQPPTVSVRMYRQGLGDCFLLTFPRAGRPLYMLIDCGVLLGTEDQTGRMERVAEDIRHTTGGHVDILIATHEHWDHLSGFIQATDVFDRIEVGELWLAWTEDPDHELATKLRRGREAALRALVQAHLRLRAAAPDEADVLQNVLEFSGPLAAAGGQSIAAALEYVRKKVPRPRYCRPGEEPLVLTGIDGVRVYVLGPPEDEKLIKKSDPTKSGREVYELAASADVDGSFLAAVAQADAPGQDASVDALRAYELSLPFDLAQLVPAEDAKADPFFRHVYYGDQKKPAKLDEWSWRQIEADWLTAANDLALKLDNDTNNTSLALAIELSPGGDILLFPGDAQVGNWLSWANLVWPQGAEPGDASATTAASLLARTVLYKVGHHASHNATLRDQGLELMTSPELVAMIPVDEKMAREKKKWDMPFGPLLRRLEEKTRGRLIRADQTVSALKAGPKPGRLNEREWSDFCQRLGHDGADELFVECRFSLEEGSNQRP